MIDVAGLPPIAQAAGLVAVVLVEAIALYAGYGLVEQLLAPPVLERIRNA